MVFCVFVFCRSGNYFGICRGYKIEILQEGVISKYKELVFLIRNIHIFPPKR